MRDLIIKIYEFLKDPYMAIVLIPMLAIMVGFSIYRLYDLWKYEKEQEKKQNENISVSALDNNKDR